MRKINRKKAQSTLEYVILIILVVAALLTMQIYVKRGIQGRLRSSADDIGEQFSTAGNMTVITNTFARTNEVGMNRTSSSTLLAPAYTNRVESMNVNVDQEYWGCTKY